MDIPPKMTKQRGKKRSSVQTPSGTNRAEEEPPHTNEVTSGSEPSRRTPSTTLVENSPSPHTGAMDVSAAISETLVSFLTALRNRMNKLLKEDAPAIEITATNITPSLESCRYGYGLDLPEFVRVRRGRNTSADGHHHHRGRRPTFSSAGAVPARVRSPTTAHLLFADKRLTGPTT